MNSERHGTVRLSGREAMCLKSTTVLPDELRRIVNAAAPGRDNVIVISLSWETAELFREAFTDYLARVGFDDDYKATSEGQLLEDLIDSFYLK